MRSRKILFVAASIALGGCASYAMAPLTPRHPAHPQAAAAGAPVGSQTLAYTAADLPSRQTVRASTANQSGHDAHHESSGSAEKAVTGEGQVIAVVPSGSQLVVEHGEIKGFMEAMTMGYRTEPASLLEGLKPGDKIKFSIDVERKAIVKIEKLK
jgi:Cu/Ag efflux protein CusF